MTTTMTADSSRFQSGYAEVNGIRMYYEVHGQGKPLVLIHGGGSTISSTFGNIIPELAVKYRLIAVELQNHGRSGHRNVPETFEQDAEDVAALLKHLGIEKASLFGFSNGGTTAAVLAMNHPEMVDKLVLASAAFKRSGFIPGFFEGMDHATIDNMPQDLKNAFLEVNPDTTQFVHMFESDRDRMIAFRDWTDEQLKAIKSPALVIAGDADVMTTEHTVEIYRLIPGSQLAIIPGNHGAYMGEVSASGGKSRPDIGFVVGIIQEFLDKPGKEDNKQQP